MHAVQRMHTKYTKLSVDESNEIARIVKVDLTSALSKAPAPPLHDLADPFRDRTY